MKTRALQRRKGLSKVRRKFLREVGLSEDAVELYDKTLHAGGLTAADAAGESGKYPSAQYRLFYRLEHYGLVRREGGRPRVFIAIAPEVAFSVAQHTKQAELATLCVASVSTDGNWPGTHLIMGKEALYEEYAKIALQAKHRIDLYTIGIAFSPELVAVQRAAVRRGVCIRHIVQEVKLSNLHVVVTWQKAGVQLRKNQAERGFHLMIFDDITAIASFSSPANTEDRLSIITDNPAALRMFRRYFAQLWDTAEQVQL